MTDAELEALCRRHGIVPEEARHVLRRIEQKLGASQNETDRHGTPSGIGLRREHFGSVMEICAHLNDMLHNAPYEDGQFYSTGEHVIRMMRQMAGCPE
jgi:hypothetical protein